MRPNTSGKKKARWSPGERAERGRRPNRRRDDRTRDDRFQNDRTRDDRFRGADRSRRDDRLRRDDRWSSDRREAPDEDLMTWSGDDPAPVDPTPVDPTPVDPAGDGTGSGFARFGLPAPLLGALAATGITEPFPIQAATIPNALAGRDVLGRGRTGSGKTLGFGLPLLTRLAGGRGHTPRGLVLVPTRELALQVADVLAPLARTIGLSVTLVAGGMPYGPQRRAFERGVDVVVATPGRLIDLMDQAVVDLTAVEITVLDEADHMADLGFLPDVRTILDTVPSGQRLLFSATLDSGINRLVREYLTDPVTHEVDSDRASVTTMSHHLLHVRPQHKNALTAEIASREGRSVIFVRTQRAADRVAEQLRATGVLAGALHGGLSQGARSRMLAAFKDGRIPVLVATDVAARGIHVDEVGLVLQVDPPAGSKEYLHRAGRTARAGGSGTVVTLVLPHQRREVDRLTRQAGVRSEPLPADPGDPRLAEATGARPPSGVAVDEGEFQRLIAPPAPKPRRSGPGRSRPFRGGGRQSGGRQSGGRQSDGRQFGGRRPGGRGRG
ncbi:MAG TPA: DEAD/DEAH box helicase [Microlunatus sp.]|nr:DEAD/DEAH box helicase [Microlunatus sp.]